MLNIIQNNPYRFLGVCSNAPIKERVANSNKLKAFLTAQKAVSFPLDLPDLLQPVERSLEDLDTANSSINQPKDQLKYALFWFINASAIDNMALEYLTKGNKNKALELFCKKENFSSLINRSIMAFASDDNGTAIQCITKVIHYNDYRKSFIEAVCGNTFKITEDELALLFIDTLLEEIPADQLKPLFAKFGTSSNDDEIINEKAVGMYIEAINSAIADANNVKRDKASEQLQAGTKLMNSTKKDLQAVKSILGTGDMQYQMVADNLAKHILQCGINYYNNTSDDDDVSIDKAMTLQSYALSIAVGKLTKDRCQENVDILKKKKADLPPSVVKNEANAIFTELEKFCNKPDLIIHAISLLNNTKSYLKSMKNKLGASNAYYLKLSTLVLGNAMHNVIEEVNAAQANPLLKAKLEYGIATPSDLEALKSVLKSAWKATIIMDDLDAESDFKSKYNSNRSTLKNLCNSLGVSTFSGSGLSSSSTRSAAITSSTSSTRNTQTTTSASHNGNTGKDTSREMNPIVAVIIIHVIWGLFGLSDGIIGFFQAMLCGLAGWFPFPINYIVYKIIQWAYNQMNK